MENTTQMEELSWFAGGDNIKEYYKIYLSNVCELKESSVGHYLNALNYISLYLRQRNLVKKDIYEIGSLEQLDDIWKLLQNDSHFIDLNTRGHRMYSTGYKRYHQFVSGQEFLQYKAKIIQLDIPMMAKKPAILEHKVWKRSGILKTQVIAGANYTCEMNMNHTSFLAENTHKPYMEAHHVIPLRLQGDFANSLDVYANIICLCPVCHRKIHYGIFEERREMVDEIYEHRKERLLHSGFVFSKNELENLILNAN